MEEVTLAMLLGLDSEPEEDPNSEEDPDPKPEGDRASLREATTGLDEREDA